MYTVTREIRFCYAHRLTGPDQTWRHLHGHNARLLITLASADLDRIGMVMDFTQLKRVVGGWIGEHLDHKTLLHREDPLVPVLRQSPGFVVDFALAPDGRLMIVNAQDTGSVATLNVVLNWASRVASAAGSN